MKQLNLNSFLLILSIFILITYAANAKINPQTQDNLIIYGGKCYKVLEYLRESYKNDSIAVHYFLNNFDILGKKNLQFKEGSSPNVIINYFSKENNKDLSCKHKHLKMDRVLLDTSSNQDKFRPR